MKLSLAHRIWLYSLITTMFLTGTLWAISRLWFDDTGDFDQWQLSFEHWTMVIHGTVSTVFLVVLGTLFPVHIKRSWAAKMNIVPGVMLLSLIFILIATGCGLYYFGDENLRASSSWIHLIGGLCLPLLVAGHIALGRRSQR